MYYFVWSCAVSVAASPRAAPTVGLLAVGLLTGTKIAFRFQACMFCGASSLDSVDLIKPKHNTEICVVSSMINAVG